MKKESSGFIDTVVESFQFTIKNITTYLWMSIILMLPVIIIGGIAFFLLAGPAHVFGQEPSNEVMMENAVDPSFLESDSAAPSAVLNATGEIEDFNFSDEWDNDFNFMDEPDFGAVAQEGFAAFGWMFGGGLVAFVLYILYSLFAALNMIRLTTELYHERYKSASDILSWSWSKFGSYLMMTLRIFGYTFVWLPILAMLAFAVINLMVQTGTFSFSEGMLTIVNYILGFVGIVSVIIIIMRSPRVVTAQYALTEKDTTSKEALDYSIKLSEGNWWMIAGYILGLMAISWVITWTLETLLGNIELVYGLVIFAFNILFTYLSLVFYMKLYKKLEGK